MTIAEIKSELNRLQNVTLADLNYDYGEMNKLRFDYDYLQLQIQGAQMLESLEPKVEVADEM